MHTNNKSPVCWRMTINHVGDAHWLSCGGDVRTITWQANWRHSKLAGIGTWYYMIQVSLFCNCSITQVLNYFLGNYKKKLLRTGFFPKRMQSLKPEYSSWRRPESRTKNSLDRCEPPPPPKKKHNSFQTQNSSQQNANTLYSYSQMVPTSFQFRSTTRCETIEVLRSK